MSRFAFVRAVRASQSASQNLGSRPLWFKVMTVFAWVGISTALIGALYIVISIFR